jgi:hypothetical protein
MCADPGAPLPDVFYGQYLFQAEITEAEGLKLRPTFWTGVSNVPAVLACYRQMGELLHQATSELKKTASKAPARCRVAYDAEACQIRWLDHTVRTEISFYESCQRRDRLLALVGQPARTPVEKQEGLALCAEWRLILLDELDNARGAVSVARKDMRLDFYYGSDHTFPHLHEMLRLKIRLLRREIDEFLPSLVEKLSVD